MECRFMKRPLLFRLVGAICLLHGVTSMARIQDPVNKSKEIDPEIKALLEDISSQNDSFQDNFNLGIDSVSSNNTDISSNDDELDSVNGSVSELPGIQESRNRSLSESSAYEKDPSLDALKSAMGNKSLPSSQTISNVTNTQTAGTTLNRLKMEREMRRLQRLQVIQNELPRRLGRQRGTKVTEEMRQKALELFRLNSGFPLSQRRSFETHQCFRAVCALPTGTDSRLWNDLSQPALRLLYRLPKINRRSAKTVDEARLKLFVKPRNDCTCPDANGRYPYLIVTVYQFLRPLSYRKRNRIVYRHKILSDIKVPRAGNLFVALDITSAVKTWMVKTRRNFGLEVTVQDANQTYLNARDVFDLPECNSDLVRTCRPDKRKSIEHVPWEISRYGTGAKLNETGPYVEVFTLNHPENSFEKYTLYSKKSLRHLDIRSRNSNSAPRPRDNIRKLFSRQFNLERKKAQRLRQFKGRIGSLRKDPNPLARPLSGLSELRGLWAELPAVPSFQRKPTLCDCNRRPPIVLRHPPLTTTTAKSLVDTLDANLSDSSAGANASAVQPQNVPNNAAQPRNSSLPESQTATDSSARSSRLNSLNSSKDRNHSNSSSLLVTNTTLLEWKVILKKLQNGEPLCKPKRILVPITDKAIIGPREYSSLECPETCVVCKGRPCVRQKCTPYGYGRVYGFKRLESGRIVGVAIEGHSTVMRCRCSYEWMPLS